MPRPPTRHGLEKKYKPWRKGKSSKPGTSSASRASLKNKLRSQRRLLTKLPVDDPSRSKIEDTIKELEAEISDKQQTQKERKNAEKYHQVRFFDRQRLTRLERTTRRLLEEAKGAADVEEVKEQQAELDAIILDKLYVAYFPNDTKYFSLFKNGERIQDDEPTAKLRREIRDRIASDLKKGKLKSKTWFNLDEVKDVKNLGSVTASVSRKTSAGKRKRDEKSEENKPKVDKPSAKPKGKEPVVWKKKVVPSDKTTPLSKGSDGSDGSSSSSSSSSSCPSSSDDGDSSDDEEQNKPVEDKKMLDAPSDSESSSSSSSSSSSEDSKGSSSDSESGEEEEKKQPNTEAVIVTATGPTVDNDAGDSEDDFFVDDDDAGHTFDNAAQYSTGYEYENTEGDKSRGWATQKQRPGQYKKRRSRY